ncbi:hypothetical protein Asulf_01984 [Archaeoglobus sulfaticallidus PM70-1]|uniref:tRNA (pseudouridine(54)-N(1))-methyltransferase n=1 Tax=Archaeoglobus sulfaticallidus PM70-1 TaxID=387631 RepID=N0BNP6_9EURY|nr:tRNA (pseudouridine(54)-N(1))-methyltransferase TrmY [Archaeoglobus sulfaticallidus]AGK61950.1 hypothetical protein Asulf_01984 [Archaeoglobus sulfaticallidus PM70-1]
MKRVFIIIGNKARTSEFSLNDLPGAGRMDVICRFIAQSLLVSHGVRKDSTAIAVLLGGPQKSLKFKGDSIKYMSPDERNVAGLIRKALKAKATDEWLEGSPGVYVSRKGIGEILDELEGYRILYLREDGEDFHKVAEERDYAFVLGDHLGVSENMEDEILKRADGVVSVSPISLQADQCVVILHNILDRFSIRGGCRV